MSSRLSYKDCKCEGKGWRETIIDYKHGLYPCHCCGIPRRYRERSTFDWSGFPEGMRERLVEWTADLDTQIEDGQGFLFWGDIGTGKSHLAVAIAEEAARRGYWVQFIGLANVLDTIRRGYSDNATTADRDLQQLLYSVQFLIVDDIGVERPTDWVAEQVYQLVERRYSQKLSTGYTSNLSLEQLEEHFGGADKTRGQRIISRINEVSLVMQCVGRDRRVDKKQEYEKGKGVTCE